MKRAARGLKIMAKWRNYRRHVYRENQCLAKMANGEEMALINPVINDAIEEGINVKTEARK
jgi:hypothetical protein